jgi:hypothetical protein
VLIEEIYVFGQSGCVCLELSNMTVSFLNACINFELCSKLTKKQNELVRFLDSILTLYLPNSETLDQWQYLNLGQKMSFGECLIKLQKHV